MPIGYRSLKRRGCVANWASCTRLKRLADRASHGLRLGFSLSRALSASGFRFPADLLAALEAAERSGEVGSVLLRLAESYAQQRAFRGAFAPPSLSIGHWRRPGGRALDRESWRRAWSEVIPLYAFPIEARRVLYTTNAIEALNSKLRRAGRARGHFPTDEAAIKLLFLVLNRSEKE